MQKVILFDVDGTIMDSTQAIIESFAYSFKKNGSKNLDENKLKSLIGYTLEDIFLGLNVLKNELNSYIFDYKNKYKDIFLQKTVMTPNAIEAIKLAKTFAKTAVVTTKTTIFTKQLINFFNLDQYFDTIIGRDEVVNPKPDPEPIFKALENLNLIEDYQGFMIGDTKLDAKAAKAAIITSIGVTCGYGKIEVLEKYCDFVFEDTFKAVEFIKNYAI